MSSLSAAVARGAARAGDVLLKAWDAANERAGGVSFELFLYMTHP